MQTILPDFSWILSASSTHFKYFNRVQQISIKQFSLNLISKLYPSLDYKKYGFSKENTAKRDPKLVRVNKETITERIKTVKAKRSKSKSKKQIGLLNFNSAI